MSNRTRKGIPAVPRYLGVCANSCMHSLAVGPVWPGKWPCVQSHSRVAMHVFIKWDKMLAI